MPCGRRKFPRKLCGRDGVCHEHGAKKTRASEGPFAPNDVERRGCAGDLPRSGGDRDAATTRDWLGLAGSKRINPPCPAKRLRAIKEQAVPNCSARLGT